MTSNDEDFDEVETWAEEVHVSKLAGALEAFRGERIPGKIVGAKQPCDAHGHVELTWAATEEWEANDVYVCIPCREMVPDRNGQIVVPGGTKGAVWCPWCGDKMQEKSEENSAEVQP